MQVEDRIKKNFGNVLLNCIIQPKELYRYIKPNWKIQTLVGSLGALLSDLAFEIC